MIMPACVEYQHRLARSIKASEDVGVDANSLREPLELVANRIHALNIAIEHLKNTLEFRDMEAFEASIYIRDHVLQAMESLRNASDDLERLVDHELWPLPGYSQLLTIR